MPIRHEFTGVAASPGYAVGPLWMPGPEADEIYVKKGSPAGETVALLDAISSASAELVQLAQGSSGRASEIIEFQLAILTDNTFRDLTLALIVSGETAFAAWDRVLEAEIANYLSAKDKLFQSRAFDLQDIQARISRVLCNLPGQDIPTGVIVLADNLSPTAFIKHRWQGGGLALKRGSTTSHVAILARQFSVPMVTNLGELLPGLKAGKNVLLISNAQGGLLIVPPNAADLKAITQNPAVEPKPKPKTNALIDTNGQPIKLMINLAHLRELEHLDAKKIDGIGLVRTEFLFEGKHVNEDLQYLAYCNILNWAKGKPVFIRTLDEGGDKSSAGFASHFTTPNMRGIGLSLGRPEVFRVQIRALMRAAFLGNLHVTLPMVSIESDLQDALALFKDEAVKLKNANIKYAMPPIGIMVEVPAVASHLERFSEAAHFSIGTNDLIQYALTQPRSAGGRKLGVENAKIASIIKHIVSVGKALKKPVSVCGDAASDPAAIADLLAAGVRNFSLSPPSKPLVSMAIHDYCASWGR